VGAPGREGGGRDGNEEREFERERLSPLRFCFLRLFCLVKVVELFRSLRRSFGSSSTLLPIGPRAFIRSYLISKQNYYY
jgi:hypothetical protein